MARYYVNQNPQQNGHHEVHVLSCTYMPRPQNRIFLGDSTACRPAVDGARRHFKKVDGCYWCSRGCHTS